MDNQNKSWSNASKATPCPICKKPDFCSWDLQSVFINCRRVADGALKEKTDKNGVPYWVHPGLNFNVARHTSMIQPKVADLSEDSTELRDRVYREFLQNSPLHDDHFEALKERGFTEESIKKNLYGTSRNNNVTANKLYQKFGESLFKVPGFVKVISLDGNIVKVRMHPASALAITSQNKDGKIVAMRLRLDDVEDGGNRYAYFSLKGGVKSGTNIHVIHGSKKPRTIVVTEGELKGARWAQQFPEHTVLCLPGIGQCRRALDLILSMNPDRIILAPDQDIQSKIQVFRPVARLFGELKNLGRKPEILYWDSAFGKGCDDALQAHAEFDYLYTETAEQFLLEIAKKLEVSPDIISKGFSGCSAIEKYDDEWDETPGEIEIGSKPLPTICDDDIPEFLRDYVKDFAERLSGPIEYVTLSNFTTAVSLIGRKLALKTKLKDTWLIVPVLWFMAIGRPSAKKTPCLQSGMTFLECLAKEVLEINENNLSEWFAEVRLLSQERDNLVKSLKPKKKRNSSEEDMDEESSEDLDGRDAIKQRLTEIEYKLRNDRPKEVIYFVSDSTKEALIEALRDNPHGLLITRDELSAWLKGLGVKGREQDRGLFLELYNGRTPYVERRKSREGISLPATAGSILGGIQPGPLAEYVTEADKGLSGADGLLARFTVMWPERREFSYVDRDPDLMAKNRVKNVMKKLAQFSAGDYGLPLEESSGLPFIGFAQDAQSLFSAWLISNEKKMAKENKHEAIEAFLGKLPNTVGTLALMFHLCEFLDKDGQGDIPAVSHKALTLAIRWGEIIEAHTRKMYLGCSSPDLIKALVLMERIDSGEMHNGISVRDIYRKNWTHIKKRADVLEALTHLEKVNIARLVQMKSNANGAVTEVVLIHPSLQKKKSSVGLDSDGKL